MSAARLLGGLVALLSLPVLLGACGGGADDPVAQPSRQAVLTHEQYQEAIGTLLQSADTSTATRLFFDTVSTEYDAKECSAKVRTLAESLESLLQRVGELRPPPDADDAQREFLAAAQESVRLVGVAADDAGTGKLRCGEPMNSRIYGMPSTARAEAAIEKLEKSGYVVFGE